ncbi:MAG: saccharopine dehydrogenase NADP-binding domain-containing protein [Bacteroidia bacterium]|jgi:saccharopine dehydrogenase (NADP+, L-glutamate forming)|nr:saccharopine dehydrogenase NADP-binding domain-containing protein [Bacteroidia bacterium]
MKNILVIGAGRSSSSLIDYLLRHSENEDWKITIADMDEHLAKEKCAEHPNATSIRFDSKDVEKRRSLIQQQHFVVSMLPAFMHGDVARDCVEFGVHLATASYVSREMQALNDEAVKKNIVLINECGLDPGLDHASAMKIIHALRKKKAHIISFKSYCGGLVAPESNNNPWGYKFSWNPRNVILAGQGTAQFLENGQLKCLPYNRLFKETETVSMGEHGEFDAYANRDSISYIAVYELKNIQTMIRGTLRQKGFCKAWNVFVKLGLTDDSSILKGANHYTYSQLLDFFLPSGKDPLKQRLIKFMGGDWDSDVEKMMDYLELFSDKKIRLSEGSPAQLLQHLLEEKWKLQENDKDMIVLQHQFEYSLPGEKSIKKLISSLMVKGKDQKHTAMALTVGLPLAITVKNILTGKIQLSGVQIPTHAEIYEPMLSELNMLGIDFKEEELN